MKREQRQRSSYVTLDDLKALIPTHGEATLGLSFEAVFAKDPYAQAIVEQAATSAAARLTKVRVGEHEVAVDKPIRAGEMIAVKFDAHGKPVAVNGVDVATAAQPKPHVTADRLPRAGEIWRNGTTVVELAEDPHGLHTRVIMSDERWPMQHIGDAAATAEFLRDNGYRKVGEVPTDRECEQMRRDVERGDPFCDVAGHIQRVLDSTRADRATGDDLRKVAELHGVVPELRAGMVVRDDSRGACGEFGVIADVGPRVADVRWSAGRAAGAYRVDEIQLRIRDGRWRIVTPDITPLASLADAVAAIFAQPDRATSRRYVDIACAQLRGEPFAEAVRAVLVAGGELIDGTPYNRTPYEIALLIDGAREHERQRSRIAPGVRALSEAQLLKVACETVSSDGDVMWSLRHARVYERARVAR